MRRDFWKGLARMRSSCGSWDCLAWRREDWKGILSMSEVFEGRTSRGRTSRFFLVMSNRMRGNRQKLKHGKFHLNMEGASLLCR